MSATWILASTADADATRKGFEIVDNVVVPVNWFEVIFSHRFSLPAGAHDDGGFISTALFVGASGALAPAAWQRQPARSHHALDGAMDADRRGPVTQIAIGDMHGLNA